MSDGLRLAKNTLLVCTPARLSTRNINTVVRNLIKISLGAIELIGL